MAPPSLPRKIVKRGPPPSSDVHPALRIVRLGNTVVSFVGTVVGGLAARGVGVRLPPDLWWAVVLAAFSTAFVTAGGNVINDLRDRESDRVNHPDRPLVTGELSVGAARWGAVLLLVGSVAVVGPVVPRAPGLAVILAAAIGALLAYEFRFKSAGFGGNLLVAFLTGAVFLYGGTAVGAPLVVVPFAFMAFFATLSREVIKDMEDAAGDVDRRTLPRIRGMPFAAVTARVAVGIAVALSAVPFLYVVSPATTAGAAYLGVVALADAVFLVSVAWLPDRLHREQSTSKGAMAVALLAFLAVAFR